MRWNWGKHKKKFQRIAFLSPRLMICNDKRILCFFVLEGKWVGEDILFLTEKYTLRLHEILDLKQRFNEHCCSDMQDSS